MPTLRTDNRSVSEVVGVILMVAITVLLASTAALFVLNLDGDETQVIPTAAIETDYQAGSSDTLTLTHDSGDDVRIDALTAVVVDATPESANKRYAVESISSYDAEDTLKAGSSIEISRDTLDLSADDDLDLSSATVRLVWNDAASAQSQVLREWTGPDA